MANLSELMTRDPGWLDPEATIQDAWAAMRDYHVRHVPICKNGKLVGLITQKDLLVNSQNATLLSLPVAEIMVMDVQCVDVNASLKDAAIKMRDGKISCLPVIENGVLVGIVTDTDYLDLVVNLLD